MNKEIYSLQSLAEKIRDQQAAIDAKFAEQKPVIDNLTLIWRMGVIGAAVLAFLTFTLPSLYLLGDLWAVHWSGRSAAPTNTKQVPVVPTPSPPASPTPKN